ncbi:MAG: calcium-binding protein [Maritimibacter sp.]
MGFLFLILGFFPLFILGDMVAGSDEESDDGEEGTGQGYESSTETQSVSDEFMGPPQTQADSDPLSPVIEDETPIEGDPVDPSSEISPNTDDETPLEGDVVDADDILDPNDKPDEEFFIDGDGTHLQHLLTEQTDASSGIGYLGTTIDDTQDVELGAGDQSVALADDAETGTGEGTLSDWDGTPVLQTEGDVNVVDGGAGNDVITTGDEAAYAFGGTGDDTLSAGEGAAALFGGAGNDTLAGSAAQTYLDGGEGDDTLQGGAGDEVLRGGAHGADDADTQDDDTIDGGAGDDRISGGFGADTLSGGDGDDVIDHHGRAEQEVHGEHQEFGWHIDGATDTLDGGAGDDTLIIDSEDTATGGSGMDTFWLYNDGMSESVAQITDFENGIDTLRITLDPEGAWGDMEVAVTPSLDGLDGIVSVNGETMAILRGGASATTGDIYVELGQNITAG